MRNPLRVHSLEYPITDHCNLRCANCDHASPLLHDEFASVERFRADLEAVVPVMTAGDFRILGGEPLLHPQLLELLRIARALHIADTVTLITNGVLLHKAPVELWECIDRLWVSVYPGVALRMSIDAIRERCEQHGVFPDIRNINSFHRTLVNHRNTDPVLVQSIFDSCKLTHEWQCYTLYDGYFFKCAPAPYLTKRLALRGMQTVPANVDGVKLAGTPDLRSSLEAYLSSCRPLNACAYCLGSSGAELGHRQLNKVGLHQSIVNDDPSYPMLVRLGSQ